VERVLEVGRGVGGDHERGAARREDPGHLGHVGLGAGEVLEDVGRADPVDRARAQAEPGSVHGREAGVAAPPAARSVLGGGRHGGVGVVVDPDHRAARAAQARGLVAHAAADVEYDAVAEPGHHLAVAGVVERQEGVGRGALHGALSGEPH